MAKDCLLRAATGPSQRHGMNEGVSVGSDMEALILEQLRELRLELRAELTSMRADIRAAMIEVGALKTKVAAIAAVAALVAAGVMQIAGQWFFR